jgi:molybdate transport system substrate-binding protein
MRSCSIYAIYAILLLFFLLPAVVGARQSPILVSAAISLRQPILEAYQLYKQQGKGRHIQFNFASSGSLKMQIEHGGAVDLFAPAAPHYLKYLAEKGLISSHSEQSLASNRLLLVSSNPTAQSDRFAEFKRKTISEILLDPKVKRVVIGDPRSVPVGQYAREVLTRLNVWERLQGKLIFAQNARQVVEYLRRKEVDIGLTYATDWFRLLSHLQHREIESKLYSPIHYPIGVTAKGEGRDGVEHFYKFLLSAQSRRIFTRYGFADGP